MKLCQRPLKEVVAPQIAKEGVTTGPKANLRPVIV